MKIPITLERLMKNDDLCFMIQLNFPDSLKVPFRWRKNLKWDQFFGLDYYRSQPGIV